MASSIHVGQSVYSIRVIKAASAGKYCAAARNLTTLALRTRKSARQCCRGLTSPHVSFTRLEKQQSIRVGGSFEKLTTLQVPKRSCASGVCSTRAGIKKKIKKALNDFEISLQEESAPKLKDVPLKLAVSMPLRLASFEGLFLVGWVASLRGLLPGSRGFFAAADLILCSVMLANFAVEWYALEHSRSEIGELRREINTRKIKAAGAGFLETAFSLALSFIPFANLFMWMRFASKQRHLPAKPKAALVASAMIYEGPRFFSLLLLISGGLRVFLQVALVSNVALLFSALHRPFAEARVKNEKILMEVSRSKRISGKKGQDQKPKEKEISAEEKERLDRLRELQEFDMLLAQRSSPDTGLFSCKASLEPIALFLFVSQRLMLPNCSE